MNKVTFRKVVLINISAAFLYGVIICPIIAVIFYAVSGIGSVGVESGFIEGLYPVIRFGFIVGAIFGFIFAFILGMLLRPFKGIVSFRNEDSFLSDLNAIVNRLNYRLDSHNKDLFVFKEKKSRFANLSVRVKNNNAIIYGHFNKVSYLKKYLLSKPSVYEK